MSLSKNTDFLVEPGYTERAHYTVPDPDFEISGGGAMSKKNFFQPFGPQFGLRIRGAGRWTPLLDPPLDKALLFSLFLH